MDSGMFSDAFKKADRLLGCAPEGRPVNRCVGRIKTAVFCLLAALMIPGFCANLHAQRIVPVPAPNPQGGTGGKVVLLKMRVDEGRVTADITDAPLQQVLKELAERTGIVFEVRSQENPPVSIHLQHVLLPEAIQRIAAGSNAIFYYGKAAESERITLVRIFSRMAPGPQPSLLYIGTGEITKTNYTVETPEQALQVLASTAGIEDKEIGIEILTKSKGEAAVKALMGCMSDPVPEIRVAAIEGLAAMGTQAALPAIVKRLKDEHPGVRQSATTAIALLGNAGYVKDLKPLSFDKDPGVAAAAEVAIRKLSATEKK
jgi:hypothetical protein